MLGVIALVTGFESPPASNQTRSVMYQFFFTLLLVAVHGIASAQPQECAPSSTLEMAANVSVGEFSVWSAYPDRADFVLNFSHQRLVISLFEGPEPADWISLHYQALVGQVAPNVYRAEVNENFWVEVNTESGETYWHSNCVTTPFRLPCGEGEPIGLR